MSDSYRVPLAVALVVMFATAVLPFYPYAVAVRPKRNAEIRALDAEIADLDRKVEMARAAERTLPQFRDEVRRLEVELAKLKRIMPIDIAAAETENDLRTTASANGVTLVRIAPLAVVDRQLYREHPYDIAIRGPLAPLTSFFTRLSNKSRIYDATNVELRRDGDSYLTTARVTAYSAR